MIKKNSIRSFLLGAYIFWSSYLKIFLLGIQGIYKKVLHVYWIETADKKIMYIFQKLPSSEGRNTL